MQSVLNLCSFIVALIALFGCLGLLAFVVSWSVTFWLRLIGLWKPFRQFMWERAAKNRGDL